MKKKKWMVCMGGILLALAMPVMGATNEIGATNLYYDITGLVFPFKEIKGFLVSPIQQKAVALAPFGQVRNGYVHEGLDIKVDIGTPLYAVADGTIIKAAPDSKGVTEGGGHMVFIDHGEGVQSWYMHLSAYAVKVGDKVKAGDVIGFSGNSGDSSTPHLHYEYRIAGVPLDPTFIFEASDMLGKEEQSLQKESLVESAVETMFFVKQS